VVLFSKNVWESPVAKAMDVSEFPFAVEDFLRPFSGQAERHGEGAEELDYLGNVIVVLAVLGARLGIEEIVSGYELENLRRVRLVGGWGHLCGEHRLTIAAILQTSVLAPHLAPRMTSGERYCRVWMSFVKW